MIESGNGVVNDAAGNNSGIRYTLQDHSIDNLNVNPVQNELVGTQDATQDATHDATQDTTQDELKKRIIEYCHIPRSKKEIAAYLGFADEQGFAKRYLRALVAEKVILMTIPDKPKSKKQKTKICCSKPGKDLGKWWVYG